MTVDVAQLVAQSWPFVGAAVGAYGTAVLTQAGDAGATATVSLGRRVLRRLWDQGESPYLLRAVEGAAEDPADEDAQAALRTEIRRLLREDEALARELAELLSDAPPAGETYTAVGEHSVVVRENHGVISTGGDVTVQR
ncbi:hypothetical protein NPS70_19970 [Streptomyces sp. C10-9-1]|uniref:hypothetical protein n=1 Tax=Streptomyces sp. C10-9-1 TaxID=1859285 RepID=UPI0021122C5C|nr:hypothetical protein [Streptomyces sp. C10-9-1]MCQ6555455.1 hypothetical protein [Streptomyces sp. C10-9-1]